MAKARYEVWIAAPDSHGDMIDEETRAAFMRHCRDIRPTYRIHLGDCFDFRPLRGKASDQESRERMGADIKAGIAFLKEYRPTHWLLGNHDDRIYKAAKSDDGTTAEMAESVIGEIEAAVPNTQVLPYDSRLGVLTLHGGISFVHGYTTGESAAKEAAITYGTVVMGHVHTFQQASVKSLLPRTGYSIGCLCRTDMEYNKTTTAKLRQANGWAWGLVYPNGEHTVWTVRRVGGRFVVAGDVREI